MRALVGGYVFLIAASARQFGFTLKAFINLPIMGVLVLCALFDLRQKVVPDWLTLPGLAWGLGTTAFLGVHQALDAAIGSLVCGGILFAFALLSRGSIGGGDVKLMAMVGAALGWKWGVVALLFAQLTAAAVVIICVLTGRGGWKAAFPFGPFLATFALLAIYAKVM